MILIIVPFFENVKNKPYGEFQTSSIGGDWYEYCGVVVTQMQDL